MPPNPTAENYSFTPGVPLYAGQATPPAAGVLLTTLALVNTSGVSQAANFVTPMFGHPFKQGDVPAGQYPAFELSDGTPCPATFWGLTHWPDGSLKWAGVLLRVPSLIGGSATLTLNVKSGGAAPAASNRATSDLTAADLKVELQVSGDTAGGAWVAALNDAISLGGDITTYGDGPAGKVWRIGGFARRSSANHGQLYCWHYVAALQDSSGGLLGLRYLGRTIKGFADTTAPGVGTLTATVAVKRGATTIRSLQGVQSDGSTLGANIVMPHYTSFFTAGPDAIWDFVQGGGSAAADCTVRVVQNKGYLVKSRLLPPYDTTLAPSAAAAVDYRPNGRGNMIYYIGNTGERDDIGVLAAWFVRHLMRQDAAADKNIRVNGLSTGGWRTCVRARANKEVVPVVSVSASYAGMSTPADNIWYWDGVNDVIPGVSTEYLWIQEFDTHHRPSSGYYPYLITGEPQYLDLLVEHAAEAIAIQPTGAACVWDVSDPVGPATKTGQWQSRDNNIGGTVYKGSGVLFREDMYRLAAWAMRDIGQASAIYPTTCPRGTEVRKYLTEVINSIYSAHQAYRNAMPASFRADGIMGFLGLSAQGGAYEIGYDTIWTIGYLCHQAAQHYSCSGNTGAQGFAAHMANMWAAMHRIGDIAVGAGAYDMMLFDENGIRYNTLDKSTFRMGDYSTLSFNASTDVFTLSGYNTPANVTNGDRFMFKNGTKPFASATNYKVFYAVQASGATFKLAATPGGAPIDVTTTGSTTSHWTALANFAPMFSYEGSPNVSSAPDVTQAAMHHLVAAGFNACEAARAAMANVIATRANFIRVNEPKNAMTAAYPA